MTPSRRHARRPHRPRVHPAGVAGTHTRLLRNVTTPGVPDHPVQEVRIEHGGVYVLLHLPRNDASTYVGASLRRLHKATEDVRMLLPDRYRTRVTAALVIPTDPASPDAVDAAASVHGVLLLDAVSLAHAVRCATPAFSTSEVGAVESLLRRQLSPTVTPDTAKRRRWLRLPRMRSRRTPVSEREPLPHHTGEPARDRVRPFRGLGLDHDPHQRLSP